MSTSQLRMLQGVMLGLTLSFMTLTVQAQDPPCGTAGNPCSRSSSHLMTDSGPNSVGGFASNSRHQTIRSNIDIAGPPSPAELLQLAQKARDLLAAGKEFRLSITPYQESQDFTDYVKDFEKWVSNNQPDCVAPDEACGDLSAEIQLHQGELRQATVIYTYLAGYTQAGQFVVGGKCSIPDHPKQGDLWKESVDWCAFGRRMGESMREMAYIHSIFGQQFMVNAVDYDVTSSLVIGSEDIVRTEIRQFERAEKQMAKAEDMLLDAFSIEVGPGCRAVNFFDTPEWDLLYRVIDARREARFEIGRRQLVKADYAQKEVIQDRLRRLTSEYGAKLAIIAGASSGPRDARCAGAPPAADVIAGLSASLSQMTDATTSIAEGRDLFGMDSSLTPSLSFDELSTNVLSVVATLDETYKGLREAEREFDDRIADAASFIIGISGEQNSELARLSGCQSPADATAEAAFDACVQRVLQQLPKCYVDKIVASADVAGSEIDRESFNKCVAAIVTNGGSQLVAGELLSALRRAFVGYLDLRAIQERAKIAAERVKNEEAFRGAVLQFQKANEPDHLEEISFAEHASAVATVTNAVVNGVVGSITAVANPVGAITALTNGGGAIADAQARREGREREIYLRKEQKLIAAKEHEKTVKNMKLDIDEILVATDAQQETIQIGLSDYRTMAASAANLLADKQRRIRYQLAFARRDGSLRFRRDALRLQLRNDMERAVRRAYLLAKRAEFEFGMDMSNRATRLSGLQYDPSDVFSIRDPIGLKNFVEHMTSDFNVLKGERTRKWTDDSIIISLRRDILKVDDSAPIGDWLNAHVCSGCYSGGTDSLQIPFSTSPGDGWLLADTHKGYDTYSFHVLTSPGISPYGQPSTNTGVQVRIESTDDSPLGWRNVRLWQSGGSAVRTATGCVWDYRLVDPSMLLWQFGSGDADGASVPFRADVVGRRSSDRNRGWPQAAPGHAAGGTLHFRPFGWAEWRLSVELDAPSSDYVYLDPSKVFDVLIQLSTAYVDRGEPPLGGYRQPDSTACRRD